MNKWHIFFLLNSLINRELGKMLQRRQTTTNFYTVKECWNEFAKLIYSSDNKELYSTGHSSFVFVWTRITYTVISFLLVNFCLFRVAALAKAKVYMLPWWEHPSCPAFHWKHIQFLLSISKSLHLSLWFLCSYLLENKVISKNGCPWSQNKASFTRFGLTIYADITNVNLLSVFSCSVMSDSLWPHGL